MGFLKKEEKPKIEQIANGDLLWQFDLRRGMSDYELRQQINRYEKERWDKKHFVDAKKLYDFLSEQLSEFSGEHGYAQLIHIGTKEVEEIKKINFENPKLAQEELVKKTVPDVKCYIRYFGADGTDIGVQEHELEEIVKG